MIDRLLKLLITITTIKCSTQNEYENVLRAMNNYEELSKNNYANLNNRLLHDTPKRYDYIIVGSGSAGSVLANRLSENSKTSVLLLESGGPPMFHSELPFLASAQQFTRQNWGYLMEKQDNFSLGLEDELMAWPRGRVLGGTTVINYMIHIRGNKHDYNRWANLGNPGWSYDEVLPYFLKSEDADLKIQDDEYHNQGGLLNVQDVPYRSKSIDVFVKGCQQAGYDYVDYNGKNQLGVSYVQATLRRGARCSAEKAFIRPAQTRRNLDIRLNSHVTKVLIDPNTKRAYGVEYLYLNRKYVVNASVEVILSAGAFHSPQILMLSGIGPADHLAELGIPALEDLPVGTKMYDHVTFLGLVFKVNKPIVINFLESLTLSNFLRFSLYGTGPFTSIGGVEGLAYFKTPFANYTENYPDMELIFIGGGLHTDLGLFYKRMFRVSRKVYRAIWEPLHFKNAFSIFPMALHPKSIGYIKLRSTNPLDAPKFYGNYFTDPDRYDVNAFIAAIRECQRIIQTPAFQEYETQQVKTPVPGCEGEVYDSDQYWECALRHITATLHHQISTCKMGPRSDPEAVVDSRCRVHGVKRLRVIDTSIIPTTISAHINVPAFMIGERAADFIKEDYDSLVLENISGK